MNQNLIKESLERFEKEFGVSTDEKMHYDNMKDGLQKSEYRIAGNDNGDYNKGLRFEHKDFVASELSKAYMQALDDVKEELLKTYLECGQAGQTFGINDVKRVFDNKLKEQNER